MLIQTASKLSKKVICSLKKQKYIKSMNEKLRSKLFPIHTKRSLQKNLILTDDHGRTLSYSLSDQDR